MQEARKEYKQLVETKAKKELEAQGSAEAKATAPPPIDDLVGTPCSPWHNLQHSTVACPIQHAPYSMPHSACPIQHAAYRTCLPPTPEPFPAVASILPVTYPMHEPPKRSAPGGRKRRDPSSWRHCC